MVERNFNDNEKTTGKTFKKFLEEDLQNQLVVEGSGSLKDTFMAIAKGCEKAAVLDSLMPGVASAHVLRVALTLETIADVYKNDCEDIYVDVETLKAKLSEIGNKIAAVETIVEDFNDETE